MIPLDQQFLVEQVFALRTYDAGTIAFYYTVLNYLYSGCIITKKIKKQNLENVLI